MWRRARCRARASTCRACCLGGARELPCTRLAATAWASAVQPTWVKRGKHVSRVTGGEEEHGERQTEQRHRDTEAQRHRGTETQRHRDTDTDTDTHTHTHTERERERERERCICIYIYVYGSHQQPRRSCHSSSHSSPSMAAASERARRSSVCSLAGEASFR